MYTLRWLMGVPLLSRAGRFPVEKDIVEWSHDKLNSVVISELNHNGDVEVVLGWLRDQFYDHFDMPTNKKIREILRGVCLDYVE